VHVERIRPVLGVPERLFGVQQVVVVLVGVAVPAAELRVPVVEVLLALFELVRIAWVLVFRSRPLKICLQKYWQSAIYNLAYTDIIWSTLVWPKLI
jgi:hypothetical protein